MIGTFSGHMHSWRMGLWLATCAAVFPASLHAGFDEIFGVTSLEDEEAVTNSLIAPQVSPTITLKFNSKATVGSSRILLDGICQCEGLNCDSLYSIDLGESPEPGRSKNLALEQIKQAITRELPNATLIAEGPQLIHIEAAAQDIQSETVKSILQSRLDKINDGNPLIKISLKYVQIPTLRVRPGDFVLNFPDLNQLEQCNVGCLISTLSGYKRFQLEYIPQNSQEKIQSVAFFAAFEVAQLLPVAITTIAKGTTLESSMFALKYRKLTTPNHPWVTTVEEIQGSSVKASLNPGDFLRKSLIAKPFFVKAGELVNLKIESKQLKLSGKGKALSRGALGDEIEVVYEATKKRVRGKVIGQGLVEVKL